MTATIHTGESTRLPTGTRPRTPVSGLGRAGRWLLAAGLGLLGSNAAQAQLNYSTGGFANPLTPGTYIDLGATGTAITMGSTDDANSTPQNIGFTFNFNGTAFTDFVMSTNGLIRLGTAAPSSAALYFPFAGNATKADGTAGGGAVASTNAADVNLLMPFNVDLIQGTGTADYRVRTDFVSGSSGPRVCTIQWKNVADKAKLAALGSTAAPVPTQYTNMAFQIRLFEGTDIVEFVYNVATPGATTAFKFVEVAIKGSSGASTNVVLTTKGSTQAWSATSPLATYGTNRHNVRGVNTATPAVYVGPDAGRTYRFAPTRANDAAVTLLYTQGQLGTFSAAHVVRAIVQATGSNATYTGTATLTVTRGVTTLFTDSQPVTNLAANATITVPFAPYDAATMANAGANIVTVSVGPDDNNSNNAKSLDQEVSATTVNYASPVVATTPSISFTAGATGKLGARFTIATSRQVNSIQAYMTNTSGTVVGVLFTSAGVELGRSTTVTLTPANGNQLVTLPLVTPIVIGAGDFLAGVEMSADAVLGAQPENPTRNGTFYQINAGPALSDLGPTGFGRFNLGAVTAVAPACAPVNGMTATAITINSATINFNASPSGPIDYTVTYTAAGSMTGTTVMPNPTASGVPLSGLMPGTQYTVDITSNCGGSSSSPASFTFTTLPTTDAAVDAVYTLGRLPTPFGAPHAVKASIKNNGTSSATISATLTVTGPSGYTFTDTQTTATPLGANASTVITFAPYPDPATGVSLAVGTYTVTVTTSLAGDQLAGNNTQSLTQDVNTTTFGYAVPGAPSAGSLRFVAASSTASFGSRFTLTAIRQITAVTVFVGSSGTMTGELYSATGALLGSSAATAVTAGNLVTLPLLSPVTLAAGDFIAAVRITNLAGIGLQAEAPTRSGTFYQISGGALFDQATANRGRFYIEAVTATAPACGQVSGLTLLNQTDNSVSVGFTPPVGSPVTNYTATLTRTTGGTLVGTQTVTASPFTFTGLTSGTNYTISVVTNCTNGGMSAATVGNFTVLTNLVISGPTTISGANSFYNVTITGTGVGTLATNATMRVFGVMTLQPGSVYNTNITTFTSGPGRLVAQPGSTISVDNTKGIDNSAANGDFNFTGGFDLGNDINIIYNNTGIVTPVAAQVTGIDAPATVRSITVNSSLSGINKRVVLTNSMSVRQLVYLQNGDLDTDGQTLNLLSTRGVGTALIDNGGIVAGSTGGIVTGTGFGIMQRAVDITTPDNIGYHHYSAPVSNTTFGDLTVPGIFSPVLNDASNYNTAAMAGTVRPFPTVFGYDETRVGSTTVATDQTPFFQGYLAPANASALMVVGKGYTGNVPNAAVVDFTVDLNTGTFNNAPTGSSPSPIVIGSLTRGTNAESGWQLLGNPFPSPLDWTNVSRTNVDAAMYIYHATGRYTGNFTTYLGAVPGNLGNVVGGGTPIIDAGSGFFTRVTTAGTPGSVSMSNTDRVKTFAGQPAFGRQSNNGPGLSLQVRGTGGSDVLTVYTHARATTGIDAEYDATKLQNPSGLNLAALAGTTRLAINGLPALTAATVIPLTLGAPAPGTYTLEVARMANMGTLQAYLRDAVAGTVTPLVAGTQVRVALTNVATATTRFSLVFRPSGALATAASLTAGQVSLYPNPAHSQFTVLLPPVVGAKEVKATLLNALGQVVTTRTIALTAAGATAEFNTSALAQGVYMLRLTAGNETLTQRVVVE